MLLFKKSSVVNRNGHYHSTMLPLTTTTTEPNVYSGIEHGGLRTKRKFSNTRRQHIWKQNRAVLHSSTIELPYDSSNDSTTNTADSLINTASAIPLSDEPNLYNIPETLYPTYRPISIVSRLFLSFVSLALSSITTWPLRTILSHKLFLRSWMFVLSSIKSPKDFRSFVSILPWKEMLIFVVKATIFMTLSSTVWQDKFLPPSRVSTTELVQKYYLPSKLSKLEAISLNSTDTTALNVHFLEYERDDASTVDSNKWNFRDGKYRADLVYANHGFGASSLSWLPVLPKLTKMTGARVGLGHDAVGFGFTDRPFKNTFNSENYLQFYTKNCSAQIAVELAMSRLGKCDSIADAGSGSNDFDDVDQTTYSILLFGHSMGSITSLRMALQLQNALQEYDDRLKLRIRIILVAPALGYSHVHKRIKSASGHFSRRLGLVGDRVVYPALQQVGRYILRRTVGKPGFWRSGLSLAWGDKKRLSDSDVLRYQWPSIGLDWEQGLLNFAVAQTAAPSEAMLNKNADTRIFSNDKELLQAVLDLPEVESVDVIIGSKDNVVKPRVVENFLRGDFPNVRITKLEGQGHDPFEEDIDMFLQSVDGLLNGSKVSN